MSISFDDIASYPLPGMASPSSFLFSNDGKLMYLNCSNNSNIQQLYEFDLNSNSEKIIIGPSSVGIQEDNLTQEEELRRQRLRMLSTGITHYEYNKKTCKIMIPMNNNIYIVDNNELKLITNNAITPTFSPNGNYIGFVRENNLFILDVNKEENNIIQLTDSKNGKTSGLADYIAQEELHRSEGFWFSNDSSKIAFCEVDETNIPEYVIVHQGKETITSEKHRYPFAGCSNGIIKLGVIDIESKQTIWMNVNYDNELDMKEIYIARVFWWSNGNLGAELLNREQSRLDIVEFDCKTGERKTILTEKSKYWINLFNYNSHHYELNDNEYVWMSERDEFAHIYLIDKTKNITTQLTKGKWVVDEIISVDKTNRIIYFTGNKDCPTEKQFYKVSIDKPNEIIKISTEPGMHKIIINTKSSVYVDIYSSINTPTCVNLRSIENNKLLKNIYSSNDNRTNNLKPPKLVNFKNRDGVTLHGCIYEPDKTKFGNGPYPTVVYVYGGPTVQVVQNRYYLTSNLKLQYLRNKGFLVFIMDNQGSSRRGVKFAGKIKYAMGTIEVDDQVDGINWLVENKLTNPQKVGITGWSYGGYVTLLCLMKAPNVFQVGVSGAPVTDWAIYDTAYTERYMGTPQSNPKGYDEGKVMKYVDNFDGKLLLIHGMLDENVLLRHSAMLINSLNRSRKEYDLLVFPDERHMPRTQADRSYLNYRLLTYFEKHLL